MTGTERLAHAPGATSGAGRSRILAIHRYYWPDIPPYAVMLRHIVAHWRSDGHDIEVLSSQPSYKAAVKIAQRPGKEFVDGVLVRRLSLPHEAGRPFTRVLNALRLGVSVLWWAMVGRYDVIMISTSPPVLGGWVAAIAARLTGARFVYHCMDIHPEVGRISGEFAHPLVFNVLRKLDNWACRQADPVVVLSVDMERTLRERTGGEALRTKVLNNFSLPDDDEGGQEIQLPFEVHQDRTTFLFAGNIGRFQGLDQVVDAMATLRHRDDIDFILMGEGTAKAALERKVKASGARVRLVGHHSVGVAKLTMRQVNAGFVSLVPEMYRYAYPSKTMTYLEQGCPLIVAVEPESQLAIEVKDGGFGFTVPMGDGAALAEVLTRLAEDPEQLTSMRAAAARKAQNEYSETVVLDQWSAMLENRTVAYQ